MSPTQRTMKEYRSRGLPAGLVEHFNVFGNCRQDLFGFIDVVVLDVERGIGGVQVTGGNNGNARLNKIMTARHKIASQWLQAGGWLEVHDWVKVKGRYTCNIHPVTLGMMVFA